VPDRSPTPTSVRIDRLRVRGGGLEPAAADRLARELGPSVARRLAPAIAGSDPIRIRIASIGLRIDRPDDGARRPASIGDTVAAAIAGDVRRRLETRS